MFKKLFSSSAMRQTCRLTANYNLNVSRTFRTLKIEYAGLFSAKRQSCNILWANKLSVNRAFSPVPSRYFSSSNVTNSRSGASNGNEYEEQFSQPLSLSEAVKEELNYVSNGAEGDNEISFPGNWSIQKLGARVIMTQKTANKAGVQVRLSFSVNSSEEEEVPDEIVDEQELEGEEDPASGLLGEQSQSQDVEGQGDEEYFPAESSPIPDAISIEIKKNNKILHIEADIDTEGPIIRTLSFNRHMNKKNDDYETYEVNFDVLSVPVQDAMFNYLQDLGLSEEFFANLHDWASNYEQSLFIGTLNELKNFSE